MQSEKFRNFNKIIAIQLNKALPNNKIKCYLINKHNYNLAHPFFLIKIDIIVSANF